MFGKCKCDETVLPEYRKLLEQARLQIQDLQEQVLKLQSQWDKERQGLVQQLTETALPQLIALRNPRPALPPTEPAKTPARPLAMGLSEYRASMTKAPNGS